MSRPTPLVRFDLHLCTLDDEMAAAWRSCFSSTANVTVQVADILSIPADAILSPANSFGFMDGGIDLVYSRHFGWDLQDRLRDMLAREYDGELAVGQALAVPTEHAGGPLLVSAPTMRVPTRIDATVNVYLAFRAALLAIRRHNAEALRPIASLASPALGAGVGAMPFDRVARQMHAAYRDVVVGDSAWRNTARNVLTHHAGLLQ